MIEAVITTLIYLCVLALVVYLVIWVLTTVIGIPIPAKVIQILWVIVALIAILLIVRMVPWKLARADTLQVSDASGNVAAYLHHH